MAIEAISATPAFQTVSVSQAATIQPVKGAEQVTRDGETLQDVTIRPDAQTAAVEATGETSSDGAQGGGTGAYGETATPEEKVQEQTDAALATERERLKKAVEDMNKRMSNSVAKFGIHEATNRVTIKIVDKETDKVIKELPPEKTLDMIAKAWEMAGILVDERR